MILGNDAVLAAAPATSVQLAHACLAFGFELAVPASWGDELIATETLKQLSARGSEPVVQCACPYVAARLLATGADLAPFLVSVVSPPVATARYIRAAYGKQAVRITYVGACPVYRDATSEDIDAALLPSEFFRTLAARGITLSEQPRVFDSVVPPDRRRWCSVPGGLPSPDILWKQCGMRSVIELDADDITAELAQHLIARENVLVDLAPRMRCACSGVTASTSPRSARSSVTVLEPPRAFAPIVDETVPVDLSRESRPADAPAPRADTPNIEAETLAASAVGEIAIERPVSAPVERPTFDLRGLSAIAAFASGPRTERRELPAQPPAPVAADAPALDAPNEPASSDVSSSDAVSDVVDEREEREERERSAVRRRTPVTAMPRVSSGSFPRIASAEFRALPRAYVGKRRVVHLARPEPQTEQGTHEIVDASDVEVVRVLERETVHVVASAEQPTAPHERPTPDTEPPPAALEAVNVPEAEDVSITATRETVTEVVHHVNGNAPEHGIASSAANGLAVEDPPAPPPPPAPDVFTPAPPPSAASATPRRTASVTMRQTPGRDHPTSFEAFRNPAPSPEDQARAERSTVVRNAGMVIALLALFAVVLVLYTLVMQ